MSETLTELLKAVVIAALPVLAPYVIQVLVSIRGYVEAKIRNEWLRIIAHEAFDTVSYVGQVMIDPAKKAAADGKLDENEKAALKAAAMAALEQRLRDLPKHLFPDFTTRLSQAIESAVAGTKSLPASPASASAPGQSK